MTVLQLLRQELNKRYLGSAVRCNKGTPFTVAQVRVELDFGEVHVTMHDRCQQPGNCVPSRSVTVSPDQELPEILPPEVLV